MKSIHPVWAGVFLSLPGFVCAQTSGQLTELGEITVSANRIPTELSKTGSSVEVITARDLQNYTQLTVRDYLDTVTGINFAKNGGTGTTATLSLRGAYQRYVLVRIDGVDISDPSAPQVAPDLGQLLVADIERIEVLRGSQSSLYGGQAVGGVIDITTKRGKSGVQQSATLELGENNSRRINYGFSSGGERGEYSISLQHLKTDGISAADENAGNDEQDGYDNTTFNARGSYDINDQLSVKGSLRHIDRDVEFDDFVFGVGAADDTLGNHTEGKHTGATVGLEFERADNRQNHDLTLSLYDTERKTFSAYPGSYEGKRTKLDYVGSHTFNANWNTVFGASYSKENAKTSGGLNNDSSIVGAFMQLGFNPNDNWFLTAAVRNDNHSEFGNHTTWRTTTAYQATPTTKLRASASTGFRAPSNFELFDSQYGNKNLKPETSQSFDVGIDQQLLDGKGKLSFTYFTLDTTDLIQYVYPDGYSQVAGESKRQGYELGLKYRLNNQWDVHSGYTRTAKAEKANGEPLVRVPKDNLVLGVNYRQDRWAINATGKYAAGLLDTNYGKEGSPVEELDNYFVLNTKVSYQVNPDFELYGRIDNLLDKEYQTVWGYGSPDRTAYIGANIRF